MPLHHNRITAATHLCTQEVRDVAARVTGHWPTGMSPRRQNKLLCVHSHLLPIYCQIIKSTVFKLIPENKSQVFSSKPQMMLQTASGT